MIVGYPPGEDAGRAACRPYERGRSHELDLFGRVADRIAAEIRPRRVLDVGCGQGFLVECLRDRGIEAFGIDLSPHAIGEVREDVREVCRVASVLNPLDGAYDLITCIDVAEHLTEEESQRAIANICSRTADVLFSPASDDVSDPTRQTVRPQSFWLERFTEHGFEIDLEFDATCLGRQAMRVRKRRTDGRLVDALLAQRARLLADLAAVRAGAETGDRLVVDLESRLLSMQQTVGWRAVERLCAVRDRLLPAASRRAQVYWTFRRVIQMVAAEGAPAVLARLARRLRRVAAGTVFPGADPQKTLNEQYRIWLERHRLSDDALQRMQVEAGRLTGRPLISVLTPVYDPDEAWLRAAVESVRAQVYPCWELCLVDDASTRPHVRPLLAELAAADPRIRVEHLAANEGIAGASAHALAIARGEFVALLDHDDALSPDALLEVAKRLDVEPDLDLLYSDEDKIEADGRRVEPFFKPDWSPDLLLSVNYITHLSVFRRSRLLEVGGFRAGFDGSQDYDLLLRFAERTGRIAHVPKVLYHWRKVPGSAASTTEAKSFALDAGRRAIDEALRRRGEGGYVEDARPGLYTVRYRLRATPLVSIIIPTRDRCDLLRQCLDSIAGATDYKPYEIVILDNDSSDPETLRYLEAIGDRCRVLPYPGAFNFSAINNFGAARAKGEYLLFLNNDVQVIGSGWLTAMMEQAQRSGVGAVGARLLYPTGRIQHAGVVIGVGGIAGHAFKHLDQHAPSYFAFADRIRDVSAVTAACMLVPRRAFEALRGFNERLRVAFNDVDFCLRLGARGYRLVYTPLATLYHHESATRGPLHPPEDEALMWKTWGDVIRRGDRYYNPNLTREREDWSLGA